MIRHRMADPGNPGPGALRAAPASRNLGAGQLLRSHTLGKPSMEPRAWTVIMLLLLSVVGGSQAASAQTAADTTAVGDVIGDSLIPALRRGGSLFPHDNRGDPLFLLEPTTSFDGLVTLRLEQAHGLTFMQAELDTAQWIVTRGMNLRGDTADVLVEVGTRRRPGGIHTYIETNRYVFVRTPAGWRFMQREFVRGADLGDVRG